MEPVTMALLMGGSAGLGLLGNAQKRKQQQMTADMRAAEIEASPWTGQGPSTQISYAPSQWADLAQGAVGGAQLGMGIENMQAQGEANKLMQDKIVADTASSNNWAELYKQKMMQDQAPTLMSGSAPKSNYFNNDYSYQPFRRQI
jgi:hypothetical protein